MSDVEVVPDPENSVEPDPEPTPEIDRGPFAKLGQDQTVVEVGSLPKVGYLSNGQAVSGFNNLSLEMLAEEGYIPAEDPGEPVYDPSTQIVEPAGWEVAQGKAVRKYAVKPKPSPPTLEQRVAALEDEVSRLSALFSETASVV